MQHAACALGFFSFLRSASDGSVHHLILFWRGASHLPGSGESIHLHATDGEGEWLVRLGGDGLVVTREHAKGDVAMRAPASDLLLFLYGRAGAADAEVFGDATILERWQDVVSW